MQIRLAFLAFLALPENNEAFTATNTAYRARHAAQTFSVRTTALSAVTTTTANGFNSKLYDNNEDDDDDDDGIPVAWSQFQDWALMDNLPKYMIDTNYFSSKKSKKNSSRTANNNNKERQPAARWRSMVREVPELTGFDVELVRRRYSKLLLLEQNTVDPENQDVDSSSNPKNKKTPPTSFLPDILPLLEKYSFEKEGGLSGYAYGIAGVADGTQMTTPPLRGCEVTIPQGWVESEDGSCIYELGDPLDVEQGYSLDYAKQAVSGVSKGLVSSAAAASNGGLSSGSPSSSSNEDTQALVNLAALTGMLLASAAAVNTISHHVSVHVYW
eukprot:CAMPEP_0116006932 /NCGR_PEP_ID=MMETSP0321-20121206/2011_1 /TAXON_ID=163516 /ORGANISM="Leptocylindrus danicus var. danicus, Strain B650" /LENGTH=327 /DNA_ID=CAMNT_0003475557 /DNA_START=40 /DNA_END=1020 /DNA_ORIENTATION=-